MKRYSLALVLALAFGFLLGGCNARPAQGPVGTPSVTPWPESYSGGEKLDNINAKDIRISGELDHGYELNIKFVHGSRIAGVDEASASRVPTYRAYKLAAPYRLVVEFDSLHYWDYERLFQVLPDDPMLYGAFKVTETGSGKFSLFFQLKRDCLFNVTELADTLRIVLRPKEGQNNAEQEELKGRPLTEGYHITANALSAYREGALAGSGLTPALCDDLSRVVLISERYATQDEAEAKLAALLAPPAAAVLEGRTAVVRLSGDVLPAYNSSLDFTEVYALEPIRVGDTPKTLPVLMPAGVYLCSTPDGRRHLLSKPLAEEVGEETLVDIQELWIVDETGRSKRLTDFEFAAIEQAAFSPDGRRLAILERTEDSSFLYIYDMDTNELSYNLGEEGFGSMTSNFVWDSMGTAIYAVSGTEQLQLLKYDFTIPDETKRVSRVDETPMGDGNLGFFDGDLYFSDVSAEGESAIFKIKPEGGIRVAYATGSGFRISPDNKFMAILTSESLGGEETETTDTATLSLRNIATGEENIVAQNKFVVDFAWGYGGKLFYSVGKNLATTEDAYPFVLMSTRPGEEPMEVCDMMAPDFFPAPNADTLFLTLQSAVSGKDIMATYILDLG